jgi:transposase-like protein
LRCPKLLNLKSSRSPKPPQRRPEGYLYGTERGLLVSNETVCRWVLKFAPIIARNLRQTRPKAHGRWHLDEMVISIAGRKMYLWRAVDGEGEVLELLVQSRRDQAAASRLLRKLLRRQGFVPTAIVTDKLRSYGAALREIGLSRLHEQGLRANNRAENSRISRFDDANERRKASNRQGRLSASLPPTRSFTMLSACNVT